MPASTGDPAVLRLGSGAMPPPALPSPSLAPPGLAPGPAAAPPGLPPPPANLSASTRRYVCAVCSCATTGSCSRGYISVNCASVTRHFGHCHGDAYLPPSQCFGAPAAHDGAAPAASAAADAFSAAAAAAAAGAAAGASPAFSMEVSVRKRPRGSRGAGGRFARRVAASAPPAFRRGAADPVQPVLPPHEVRQAPGPGPPPAGDGSPGSAKQAPEEPPTRGRRAAAQSSQHLCRLAGAATQDSSNERCCVRRHPYTHGTPGAGACTQPGANEPHHLQPRRSTAIVPGAAPFRSGNQLRFTLVGPPPQLPKARGGAGGDGLAPRAAAAAPAAPAGAPPRPPPRPPPASGAPAYGVPSDTVKWELPREILNHRVAPPASPLLRIVSAEKGLQKDARADLAPSHWASCEQDRILRDGLLPWPRKSGGPGPQQPLTLTLRLSCLLHRGLSSSVWVCTQEGNVEEAAAENPGAVAVPVKSEAEPKSLISTLGTAPALTDPSLLAAEARAKRTGGGSPPPSAALLPGSGQDAKCTIEETRYVERGKAAAGGNPPPQPLFQDETAHGAAPGSPQITVGTSTDASEGSVPSGPTGPGTAAVARDDGDTWCSSGSEDEEDAGYSIHGAAGPQQRGEQPLNRSLDPRLIAADAVHAYLKPVRHASPQRTRGGSDGKAGRLLPRKHRVRGPKSPPRFVLKIVHKDKCSPQELGRLCNEVVILSQVSHTHVLRMFSALDSPTEQLIFLEHAPLGDLYSLTAFKSLAEHDAQWIVFQTTTVLHALHTKYCVAHCDVKPHNLLLFPDKEIYGRYRRKDPHPTATGREERSSVPEEADEQSSLPEKQSSPPEERSSAPVPGLAGLGLSSWREVRVKLGDFGLAQQMPAASLIEFDGLRGTNGYFAPELLQRKNYGFPVDMWSLGVVTFSLLAGYDPFFPASSCVHKDVEMQPRYWSDISPTGKDFVCRLLCRDPSRRMTAAGALDHPWLRDFIEPP